LMALRPLVPSEAVPERTMPMALGPNAEARERKKISMVALMARGGSRFQITDRDSTMARSQLGGMT